MIHRQQKALKQPKITYQFVEDVPLVHVDRDQRFKLGAFHFAHFARGLLDQSVEQFQEAGISRLHHFSVTLGRKKSISRITCPNQLNAKKPDLKFFHSCSMVSQLVFLCYFF